MIYNKKNNQVLILDKVVKEGWEGLTFPGGHVEEGESLVDSVRREVLEETNLTISDVQLVGCIQWIKESKQGIVRELGILYKTDSFQGNLIENNREGRLFWLDYEEFKARENKSLSMDDILKVYDGHCQEVIMRFEEDHGDFIFKNKEYR